MDYKEETTYLIFDKSTNLPDRWVGDSTLCFFGSKEDAMLGLKEEEFVAIPVSECSEELKKEYRKLIDKEL